MISRKPSESSPYQMLLNLQINRRPCKFRDFLDENQVNNPDGCWLWTGGTDRQGYAKVAIDGRKGLGHRIAYERLVEPIPAGLMACHTCDNPSCCNPRHIKLGTNTDNQRDAARKNRYARSMVDPEEMIEFCESNWPPADENHFERCMQQTG